MNLYWVGGTANWDGTAASKWSTSSGGPGGSAIPTSSDNVFIDAGSGVVTVTVAAGNTGCANLDFTGFAGTFITATISITGSFTSSAGMTLSNGGGTVTLNSATSSTITTNGKAFPALLSIGGGGTYTLQDNFVSTNSNGVLLSTGTFSANNFDVTLALVNISGTILNMGSGTWTVTGVTAAWGVSGGVTINPGTSTIKFTNTTSSTVTFAGGSKTYNNLWFARGTSTGDVVIAGTNTLNNLKDDGSVAHNINFTASTTQTLLTNPTITGSAGNLITLQSTLAGTPWTIQKTSGNVILDYVTVQDSTAKGGARWFAGKNSTNNGGNHGWRFAMASNRQGSFGSPTSV